MNVVHANGNLTADVEIKQTENNIPYACFTIASRTSNGETVFLNFKVWDKLANILKENRGEGDHIIVTAEIEQYVKDNDTGFKETITYFVAKQIEFVGRSKKT